MAAMTYRDALRQALDDAMNEDQSIVVMGEEVGRYGGAYGVTKDLIKTHGPERLIGQIVPVAIVEARNNSLIGKIVTDAERNPASVLESQASAAQI